MERKLSRIREAYQAGVDTLKEYSEMKARLHAQQLSLQKKLASAAASSVPMDVQAERQTKMYCLLHCLEDETTTIGQKYEAVAALTSCVLWNRAASTLSVTYRMELTS